MDHGPWTRTWLSRTVKVYMALADYMVNSGMPLLKCPRQKTISVRYLIHTCLDGRVCVDCVWYLNKLYLVNGSVLGESASTRPPRAICAPSNAELNSGYGYDMLPPIHKSPAYSKWHIHTLYGQRISHIASQAIFKVVFGCFYYYSWLEYIASRTLAVFKFSSRLLWMAGAHVLCTTHRNWFDPSSPEILTRFGVFGERKKLLC